VARSLVEPGEPVIVPAIAVRVAEGEAGGCKEVPIPKTWKPGRYRVAFELDLSDPDGRNVVMQPWGYFQVLPRASD
jgi:hypothetical protein